MEMLRGIFFATFIAIMIAMLFSFLPKVELEEVRMSEMIEQPVFQLSKPIELNHGQVVPFLKDIPLHYSYKQVKIDQSAMFIDLQILQSELSDTELVYQDAFTILSKLISQTTNIDQLFIRFILIGEEHRQLVLSVTAERSDRLIQALVDKQGLTDISIFLEENTKLFYGTGWSTE